MQIDTPAPQRLARRTDPVTSHAAAAGVEPLAQAHYTRIARVLADRGPMGGSWIAQQAGLPAASVTRRLPEMLKAGAVVLTGRTVPSVGARQEREWGVTGVGVRTRLAGAQPGMQAGLFG